MGKIEEYKLRRYKRLLNRLDADDDEGKWITTENNHKVHLNENGKPDKGNPHVIDTMVGEDNELQKYTDDFMKALQSAKETSEYPWGLSQMIYMLPNGYVIDVDGDKYRKSSTGSVDGSHGWLRPSDLKSAKSVKIYRDNTPPKQEKKESTKEETISEENNTESTEKEEVDQIKFSIKHPEESFSQKRKNGAVWDKSGGAEADELLRPLTEKVWRSLSSKAKDSLFQYTTDKDYGYQDINMMMREGAPDWWTEHDKGIVQNNINNITKAIDKSEAPRDMWLQRGCSAESLGKLFNVSKEQYKNFSTMTPEDIMDTISSTADYGQDKAFMSCGSGKNKGTLNEVILNIFCPKGTKMLYAEPFSRWGNGGKRDWDGRKKQSNYSDEDETILQRGTMVVPRKVTKANGRIYVDVDVIGQEY